MSTAAPINSDAAAYSGNSRSHFGDDARGSSVVNASRSATLLSRTAAAIAQQGTTVAIA